MIQSVTYARPVENANAPHPAVQPKPKPRPQKEDTVELSSVAKTYGDVEHSDNNR